MNSYTYSMFNTVTDAARVFLDKRQPLPDKLRAQLLTLADYLRNSLEFLFIVKSLLQQHDILTQDGQLEAVAAGIIQTIWHDLFPDERVRLSDRLTPEQLNWLLKYCKTD